MKKSLFVMLVPVLFSGLIACTSEEERAKARMVEEAKKEMEEIEKGIRESRERQEVDRKYSQIAFNACRKDSIEEVMQVLKELETQLDKKDFGKHAETEESAVRDAIARIKGVDGSNKYSTEHGCIKPKIDRKYTAFIDKATQTESTDGRSRFTTKEEKEAAIKELEAILAKGDFLKGFEEYEKNQLNEAIGNLKEKLNSKFWNKG